MKPENVSQTGRNNVGNLIIFKNEPIIRFLFYMKLTPIKIGMLFFCFISLTITAAGALTDPSSAVESYVGYWENISWSISMLLLFPLVTGLTAKYYLEVPRLFEELSKDIREDQKSKYREFIARLDRLFNHSLLPFLFLLLSIVINYYYYITILDVEAHQGWITNGHFFKETLNTRSGFTYAGLYSVLIQVVLVYWMINLIWKSFVFSRGLFLFFNKYKFSADVKPLHEDGCCGLKRIGDIGMTFNSIMFIIGMYLSLKVIDKIIVQGLLLSNDPGNPMLLVSYAFLAPLLFFLPLMAPHETMKRMKTEFIRPFILQYSERISTIRKKPADEYEELEKLAALIQYLKREISVWPFNFKSLGSFVGVVVFPTVPVALPFLVSAIVRLFKELSP